MQQMSNAKLDERTESKDEPKNKTMGLIFAPLNTKSKGRHDAAVDEVRSKNVKEGFLLS